MQRLLSFLFIIGLAFSCGKRDIENLLENPFLGEWKLSKISCHYADLLMEEYLIPNYMDVSFSFRKGLFYYDVESYSCSINYSGDYNVKGRSLKKGELSLFANSQTVGSCSVYLLETKSGDNAEIPFIWQSPRALNLKWSYDLATESMTVDSFNGFKGSTSIPLGCNGQCECSYTFSKFN